MTFYMCYTTRIVLFLATSLVSFQCFSGSCKVDVSGGAWSSTCFEKVKEGRKVRSEYVGKIRPNRFGNAAVFISDTRELVIVDQAGVVRVPNVIYTGDNDSLGPSAGLVRYFAQGKGRDGVFTKKCGYIDGASLGVLVPASFDQCSSFNGEIAVACRDCTAYCLNSSDCQDSVFINGTSYDLDRNGRIVNTYMSAEISAVCGKNGTAIVKNTNGALYLKCQVAPDSPLKVDK